VCAYGWKLWLIAAEEVARRQQRLGAGCNFSGWQIWLAGEVAAAITAIYANTR
jgi:hypothetical protein